MTMNFVLLFCGSPEDARAWEELSDEARAQQYEKVGRWFAQHAATIRGTNQLQPSHMATSVHFAADGKPLVTDGPFLEGTEVIGGYAEIEVADLDEALRMAKTWPGHGVVEIRPLVHAPTRANAVPDTTADTDGRGHVEDPAR